MNPTCDYSVYNDAGRRGPCGNPAKYRGVKKPRLFYCEACGDWVRREFELATLDGKSLGKPIKWTNKR